MPDHRQRQEIRVNGLSRLVCADPQTPLLYVLRNDLGLKAAKAGCDAAGQCGACAVLCEGREMPSCSVRLGEIGEREITTAEGIGSRSNPTHLQRAFFAEQASQCGYCIPGMIVAATGLLNGNPQPSDEEIRAALHKHICRCGTHTRILNAVRRAVSDSAADTGGWPLLTTSLPETNTEAQRGPASKSLAATSSDAWLSIDCNGRVTAYSGKVDMGTGLRTALIQLVAEELDVDLRRVELVMSDTALAPNQGKSTASVGLAIGGQPLRIAACEARAELLRRAGRILNSEVSQLDIRDGNVFVTSRPEQSVSFGALVAHEPISIPLQVTTQTAWGPELSGPNAPKSRDRYRYVGKSVQRDVVAEHILGTFMHVHNVVVAGMLHGRVVLPPDYFAQLVSVDETSLEGLPGVQMVRRESFLAVVAEREEVAIEAARQLKVTWSSATPLYDESRQFEQMRSETPVAQRIGFELGDAPAAIAQADTVFEADFHFGYQLHAMIGPSCAVADVRDGMATIWSGTQSPYADRDDIARILGLSAENVRLVFREAAGSYGRLGADDAAADAAVLSQAVGRPVRVQWTRRNENAYEPVGAAMSMKVQAALDGEGRLAALDYTQWTSTHASAERGSHVAWNLLGSAPGNDRLEGYLHGLHYDVQHKRGRTVFLPPKLRTLYLRGPGSVQSHFAVESSIDELALRAGIDPVEFRLMHLAPRDQEVLRTVAKLARWHGPSAVVPGSVPGEWLCGRGVAYTRSGYKPTRVAVIVDLSVHCTRGEVRIDKVFLAHDCGYMVNPDGVLNQVQGNIVHALSRALYEEVHYTRAGITTLDWDSYPVIRMRDIPELEIELIRRPDSELAGVGETASIPIVASVANAIFDATRVRLRVAPFTQARVLAALRSHELTEP